MNVESLKLQKRILVVEDDESFREVVVAIFESQGFFVQEAENGLVAKDLLGDIRNKFDLVVSDIKMPKMDGLSLLDYVKAEHPGLKFIMMTGFSEQLEGKDLSRVPFDMLLSKPFRFEELQDAITVILNK